MLGEQTTVEEGLYWSTSTRHEMIVEGK